MLVRARRMSKEWKISNEITPGEEGNKGNQRVHKHYLKRWEPLPDNSIKIDFDGSVRGNTIAAGFISRDQYGRMIQLAQNTWEKYRFSWQKQ